MAIHPTLGQPKFRHSPITAHSRAPQKRCPILNVAVGILTWNDGVEARRAVASVLETSPEVPVVVLDNGSDPPFQPGSLGAITLVRSEKNLGVAAGRNRLVEVVPANIDLVCLLDSDAELLPGCLDRLLDALAADEQLALAAPVFKGSHPTHTAGRAPTIRRKAARALRLTSRYAPSPSPDARVREVEFAIGACQVVRRTAFQQVGGYDESIFYGPEDLDLCLRLRANGWKVVQVDTAVAVHSPRRAHRNLLTARGRRHAAAVARYYLRPRRVSR